MGDRLVVIDMSRKVGAAVPLSVEELGSYPTQCGLGRGLPPYQVAPWSIPSFGHNTPMLQTYRQTDRTDNSPIA